MRHRLLIAIMSLVVLAALGAPAAGAGRAPVLDQPRNGAAAVEALGDRLPEVAQAHDATAAALRQRLEHDQSLWVDTTGRLFYIDPAAHEHAETGEASLATTTDVAGEAFTLHSRPGAKRTIYLDFTGHGQTYGGQIGGAWSAKYTGGDGEVAPYSEDNASTLSEAEQATIRSVWQRVAEDFAPFDVNVTTQEPTDPEVINRASTLDDIYGTRVVITPSSETTCGCGGVAYVGVFDYAGSYGHGYYQPAFVYTTGAKDVAEAASHEAGHNLGLSHDGTRKTGYYRGHGDWAPIMGVGYYEPITQWSRGEYSGANNKEDDFAVAASNGAPLRTDTADEHLGELSHADPALSTASADGTIEVDTDVDSFTVDTTSASTLTVQVAPAAVSPNLDVRLTVSSGGNVVATADPLSAKDEDYDVAADGLAADLAVAVGAGTYTVTVEGVGFGDPASTGYSGYGSLGDYVLTATVSATDTSGTGGSGGTSGGGDTTGGDDPASTFTFSATGYKARGGLQKAELKWSGATVAPTITRDDVLLATPATLSDSYTDHIDNKGGGSYVYRACNGETDCRSVTVTF